MALALDPFFKPAGVGNVKPELSFPGSPDVVRDLSTRRRLTHLTNEYSRWSPRLETGAAAQGADSVWERLIDLGDPDPLSDTPPVIKPQQRGQHLAGR